MNFKVCVVIVTYGNRFKYLKEVINSCIRENVYKIIVVDNASEEEDRKKLKDLEKKLQEKIRVIYLKENIGSAGGYRIGLIEAYKQKECEFIWLLDDDNLPKKNSLNLYISYYKKIKQSIKGRECAILGFRDSRPQYIEALKEKNGNILLEPENSYVGFHFAYYIKKIFRKWRLKNKNINIDADEFLEVPVAPYGGLFFKKEILDIVGYPDSKFFLYEDDTEFTFRFTKNGIKIFLVPSIKIDDLDGYWSKDKGGILSHTYIKAQPHRFYYFIRNKIYFQFKFRVTNKNIFYINKLIYDIRILAISIINKSLRRFHLYRKASNHGLSGIMGKKKPHILFVSHVLDRSGAPRSLLYLLKYLPKKEQFNFSLIAMRRNDLEKDFKKIINDITIITRTPPKNIILKGLERLLTIPIYVKHLLRINPDLVFINSSANSRAIILSKLLGYKTFVFVREFEDMYIKFANLRKKAILFADKVFVTNEIQKDWVINNVGFKKEVKIIPNGIDFKEIELLSRSQPDKKFLEFIEKYKYIVGNIGYMSYIKGWDLFIDVIKNFKNNKEVGFVIIGDFIKKNEKEQFEKKIKDLNMEERVYITGIVDNVFSYLKYVKVVAVTSRSETFSRVILESISLGIPVVSFDVGGIKAVLPHNYKYLIQPFNTNLFSSNLEKLLISEKEWENISNILLTHRKNFDINIIVEALLEELEGLF